MIDALLVYLNTHPIFVGAIMIMMNLCGRYISIDMPHSVENILAQPLIRIIFLFCVGFVATRDIKISMLLTLVFLILIRFLLNERSRNCILPTKLRYDHDMDLNKDGIITKDEITKAQQTLEKYKKEIIKKNSRHMKDKITSIVSTMHR